MGSSDNDTADRAGRPADAPPDGAAQRPIGIAIRRGLRCRCPHCGEGRLFSPFLKPVDRCAVCGEDFTHQRADDLPAYITIVIVGHILLGGYLLTDLAFAVAPWVHMVIWVPVATASAILLLQPIKGAVIGLQWAARMHGFSATAPPDMDTGGGDWKGGGPA